jgi:stage V sporulation protein G
MNVTDVKVKLVEIKSEKLQAFCTVTFDDSFVVRDIKVIEGGKGHFIAMPSRKMMDRCPECGGKNHLRARYCNDCGATLQPDRGEKGEDGKVKLHVDIAHPIHAECREMIQRAVLEAFKKESGQAKGSGSSSDPHPEGGDRPSSEGQRKVPSEPPKESGEAPEGDDFGEGVFS